MKPFVTARYKPGSEIDAILRLSYLTDFMFPSAYTNVIIPLPMNKKICISCIPQEYLVVMRTCNNQHKCYKLKTFEMLKPNYDYLLRKLHLKDLRCSSLIMIIF